MTQTDVLVLGAGLAGLSAAFHINRMSRLRCLVVEKNAKPGGQAGSEEKDGFIFDHTGHLLHLHDHYGKKLITGLMRGNLAPHQRSAWIYSHRTYTRYPFQANTYGLPQRVIDECVVGFMKNAQRPPALPARPSFEDWCQATFGDGVSRHFMFPYNRKLWRAPLRSLTTEWQGRFLPKPTAAEVLYGALTDQKKFFGYNTSFLYPVRGGSQALPDALSRHVPSLHLRCVARRVDLRERVALVEGLGEVRYKQLVTTMPLVEFLDLAEPLPRVVKAWRAKLRYVSVYNLNIGVARPRVSDKHWIYFPEDRYAFYRVGFNSNFSSHVAPPKHSALYIEIARRPDERVDLDALERQCLEGLRRCGILRPSDRLATRLWITIPCAYVVYDFNRTPAVTGILKFLSSCGVESIGRWGAWKYSFMEEAILDGKRCAGKLLGVRSRERPSSDKPLVALK